LKGPNAIVFIWWQYLRWITYRDPADGDSGSWWKRGFDVDHPIDAYLSSRPNVRSIKDRRTSGKKDALFHITTCQIRTRPYQDKIAEAGGKGRRSTYDGIFHNNAVCPNLYRAPLRYKNGTKEDATIFSN